MARSIRPRSPTSCGGVPPRRVSGNSGISSLSTAGFQICLQDIPAFLTEAFAFYLYVAYVEQIFVEAQSAEHIPLRGVLRHLLLAAPAVRLVMVGSIAAIALPTAAASLLAIPGQWLLTRWSLFASVIVREGRGPAGALWRSSALENISRWCSSAQPSP